MADGSNGYRAALGRRRLMPVVISSSRATVGLTPSISFSTSYAELGSGTRLSSGRFYRVLGARLQAEFELVTDPSKAAGE